MDECWGRDINLSETLNFDLLKSLQQSFIKYARLNRSYGITEEQV